MDIRCQQFTSKEIANNMLDMMGYMHDLYGKKILENSCGEGDILCLVVERYIVDAKACGYTNDIIVQGLENDIYGAEIVEDTYRKCIINLNIIAKKYDLSNVSWNLYNGDVLQKPFKHKFDFVIGNPPYISYKNLDIRTREFIKTNYYTCKLGKPDYCYAFIENAIEYLDANGRMVYLIPNSIYKNVFAKDLRNLIVQYIVEIRDYPNHKLFKDAVTSSAIMLLEKRKYQSKIYYKNIPSHSKYYINKNSFGEKWMFGNKLIKFEEGKATFSDYFKASITIATQRNKIFVINENIKKEYKIEQGILRRAISPRNQQFQNKEYIIFPYMIRNNKVYNYKENELIDKYPNTYTYLCKNREELDLRDADTNAQWFEYGRGQALQNMNKKKLLVSTVFTNNIKLYEVNNKAIPYSGIYIISERGHDLSLAKNILESKQFRDYVRSIGTPASGSSLRITPDDINRFVFEVGDFIDK